MDIRHLRYFIAAVEQGSFLAASRRLNIAQPAISRQMRSLADYLGVELLERDGRRIRLTRAGEAFYKDALGIVAALDNAVQRARGSKLAQEEVARIGFVRSSARYEFTANAVDAFKAANRGVRVEITTERSRALIESLRRGDIDIALLFQPVGDDEGFEEKLIHSESYLAAVHPRHALAKKPSIHMSDLSGEPLVLISRTNNSDNYDLLMQQCRAHGVEPLIGYLADSHDVLLEFVSVSGGIGLTPASTRMKMPRGPLEFRLIENFHMALQLRLVWRRNIQGSATTKLLDCLLEAIEGHQDDIRVGAAAWSRTSIGQVVASIPE